MPSRRLIGFSVEGDQARDHIGQDGEAGGYVDDPCEDSDPALHEPPELGPLLGESGGPSVLGSHGRVTARVVNYLALSGTAQQAGSSH